VAQLAARDLWVVKAAGSIPASPTRHGSGRDWIGAVLAEIQVLPSPAGNDDARYAHVDAAIAVLRSAQVRVDVGALGTTVEGAPDDVWTAMRAAHEATMRSGADSCISVIKAYSGASSFDDLVSGHRPLATSRRALHAIADQVLAGVRMDVDGEVGLTVTDDGFATPDGSVRVVGASMAARSATAPITTVRAALAQCGRTAVGERPYAPVTAEVGLDDELALDFASVASLHAWWRLGRDALSVAAPGAETTLWPEHFDVATVVGEVNLGASPGDDFSPEPYVYVGPWARPLPDDAFWNAPFGAMRAWSEIRTVDAAAAFFTEGLARAGG
jgi:uncharacterized protein YqgV (UPF0045/DUF77 family)